MIVVPLLRFRDDIAEVGPAIRPYPRRTAGKLSSVIVKVVSMVLVVVSDTAKMVLGVVVPKLRSLAVNRHVVGVAHRLNFGIVGRNHDRLEDLVDLNDDSAKAGDLPKHLEPTSRQWIKVDGIPVNKAPTSELIDHRSNDANITTEPIRLMFRWSGGQGCLVPLAASAKNKCPPFPLWRRIRGALA